MPSAMNHAVISSQERIVKFGDRVKGLGLSGTIMLGLLTAIVLVIAVIWIASVADRWLWN